MRYSRFLWRLYTGYVVLILLTVTIVGVMVSRTIEKDSLDETQAALLSRAELIRGFLTIPLIGDTIGLSALQDRIQLLGTRIGTRLTIIESNGNVLADSEEDPKRMDNHGSRPEILQARSHGQGSSTRFSQTVRADMMYLALPVSGDGSETGFVRTSLPLTSVQERLSFLRRIVMSGALLAALVALPLGFVVARRITAPVGEMTMLARNIAEGNYECRVHTDRRDEIGQLATALNTMAAQSKERVETTAREHNRLKAILAGIVEGVVAVDSEERIVHINTVAADILSVNPEKSIGRPIRELTRTAGVGDILSRAISESKTVKIEIRVLNGQRHRVVEAYASPLREHDDAVAGAVLVLHDVTDLQHLEAVRRDFMANVSHELKTPITAAHGLVETMLTDEKMDSATRDKFLGRVQKQMIRLTALVGDLLALSRLESVKTEPAVGAVDINVTVAEIAAAFEPVAHSRGLALAVHCPESPLFVNVEEGVLEQIAGNLLDNALKYTERGGRITLSLVERENHAILTVADTGCGISRADQKRVFERFYRVDKARSREMGGTGLGLSIVKHLVRSLNGTVSVSSVPGEGSTFHVSLPLAETGIPSPTDR